MKLYESINNNLKESADYDFDEIENMMANADDYSDLYLAASYIKDDSLRIDVEECIGQCEDDGDDVDVAYSVTTSDYIDPYRNEENTPTMLADWRARNTRKEAEEEETKFKSNNPFHCPVCNAELDIPLGYNMTSDKYKYDDDGWFMIDWDCKECGATGSDIFTLQFWSQGVNTPKGFVEVANYGIKPDGAGLAEVNPHQINKED